jgi:hypothetical protein
MSAWRRLALELFPEHSRYIQRTDFVFSIHLMFFELLPWTRKAHERQDDDFLRRAYQYAEWCWSQRKRSGHIYNAVCVSFYEHLVDHEVTFEAIPFWIKPEIFADLRGLFEWRLSPDRYQELLAKYNTINHTNF